MLPLNLRVTVDNKALGAEVHAIVVKTTLGQRDAAEVTVKSVLEVPPPLYRLGASIEIKLANGDPIFAGRINGIAPRAGVRQWVIRAHGSMGSATSTGANDVRIAQPIKTLTLSANRIPGNKWWMRAKLTLDPEVDCVKFRLGDTKYVSEGPGRRSFTGSVENIERRYGQFGGDQMIVDVVGSLSDSSPR
jgi:hypothetical protein